MEDLIPLVAILTLFIGTPWVILHYMTRWKTAATLTTDDEALLDELYNLARRLEARMETVERLVSADHPDFRDARLHADGADHRPPALGAAGQPAHPYGAAPARDSFMPAGRTRS